MSEDDPEYGSPGGLLLGGFSPTDRAAFPDGHPGRCPAGHPIASGHVGCGLMECVHATGIVTAARKPDPPTPFCFAVSDHETLALMRKHQLYVGPAGSAWAASPILRMATPDVVGHGSTIGDAVRACVARITEAGR